MEFLSQTAWVERCLARVQSLATNRRFVIGLAGIPGSGKSTLAAWLKAAIDRRLGEGVSAIVAMDGFHLSNAELDRLGLRAVKGSPKTFDAEAFAVLLKRVRDRRAIVSAPAYCRQRHEPIADAVRMDAQVKIVIVEGNYLLLDEPRWCAVREQIDETAFVDLPIETAMARVFARHCAGGSDEISARRKIDTNDRPNAERVLTTRESADWLVRGDEAGETTDGLLG